MSNKKIAITSDSTTDLSPELRERYNIGIIPLGITLGDKTYTDGVDIDADFIYDYHKKTGLLPKTSAINIPQTSEFFKQYTDQGYAVIHFTISSEMSTTFNNSRLAAEGLDDVYIIDSRNLSTGGGLLVLAAADMANSGIEPQEIVEKINEMALCVDASFVIDNLDYLYKGGRCSALAALGANLLKLKPCIEVKDGKMGVAKKYRGKFADVLKTYANDRLENPDDIVPDRVFITHAGCDKEIVDAVVNEVKSHFDFKEVFVTRAGCTISSHCGQNTLGVLFVKKSPIK